MPSTFGWLDNDRAAQRAAIEIVNAVRTPDTVDELGLASIRDAFSDALFPGTTVLHTRLRYALFVPWLAQDAAKADTVSEMSSRFRASEFRLIQALLDGSESEGVIGREARKALKRLPSAIYSAALRRWGILTTPGGYHAYFTRTVDARHAAALSIRSDDPESWHATLDTGLHLDISPPKDLLSKATFTLTHEEESYLSDRIETSTRGTLFAWLVRNDGFMDANEPWDIAGDPRLPSETRVLLASAEQFATLAQGANLRYELLIAQLKEDPLQEHLAASMETWLSSDQTRRAIDSWDASHLHQVLTSTGERPRQRTLDFIDRWVRSCDRPEWDRRDDATGAVIRDREISMKRGRARVHNGTARDAYRVAGDVGRMHFRWGTAKRHLADLYDARAIA